MIKIFHTGDFHLDSPFSGYDVKESDKRRAECRESFAATLKKAVEDGCGIVLIAGDLFDCGYVTSETVSKAFSAIEECKIPVVVAPGNHDPYEKGGVYDRQNAPKNLFVFSSGELTRFDFDEIGISVHGYAFTSDRMDSAPLNDISLHEKNVNVLLAHGDIYSPLSKYAPISSEALECSGFDYAALGHVHKAEEPVKMGKTLVSYCGFPMGRGFDELGFGSALEVTIDGSVKTERVVLADKRYMIEALDVTGVTSSLEINSAISSLIKEKNFGKETSLRVVLTGAVSPDVTVSSSISAELFGLALLEIENETSPVYDTDFLENDVSLRGALYRQLLPSLKSADPHTKRVAAEALRIGLAALEGKQIF